MISPSRLILVQFAINPRALFESSDLKTIVIMLLELREALNQKKSVKFDTMGGQDKFGSFSLYRCGSSLDKKCEILYFSF